MTQYVHFKKFKITVNVTYPPPTPLYVIHAYRNGFQGLAVLCGGNAADKSMTNVFMRKSIECGREFLLFWTYL